MEHLHPGARWVSKSGNREIVVEHWWCLNRGDVRNVATGRKFSINRNTLTAKYRPVLDAAADQ